MTELSFPSFGYSEKTTKRHTQGWKYVGWIARNTPIIEAGVGFDQLVESAKQDHEGKREVDVYTEGAICWWLPEEKTQSKK